PQGVRPVGREGDGADHRYGEVEGVQPPGGAGGGAVHAFGHQAELVPELVAPLRAERGGGQDEDLALALRDELGDDEARLHRRSQPDLGAEDAGAEGQALEGEDRGLELVGVEVDAGGGEGGRDAPDVVSSAGEEDLLREDPLMEAAMG